MYGIVSLPSRIVEPLIALSIAYVAIENLMTRELKPWRLALVFMFGLLHGLGFAGVLRELGLPRGEFLTALLSFNLGVEGGPADDHRGGAARGGVGISNEAGTAASSCVISAMPRSVYWTIARSASELDG